MITPLLIERVRESVEDLIVNSGVDTFLFGSKSEFDELCRAVVGNMRSTYPHISRIYVRAEFPFINEGYKRYLNGLYEDTYYPEKIRGAAKSVYIQRNREMIDKSAYCIIYCNKSYQERVSGTEMAYRYAMKRGRKIKNVADT